MESEDQKEKPYSPPTFTKLTPKQARKLVADRRNCSEEEAAEFLDSFRAPRRQNEEKRNKPGRSDARDEKWKCSA